MFCDDVLVAVPVVVAKAPYYLLNLVDPVMSFTHL